MFYIVYSILNNKDENRSVRKKKICSDAKEKKINNFILVDNSDSVFSFIVRKKNFNHQKNCLLSSYCLFYHCEYLFGSLSIKVSIKYGINLYKKGGVGSLSSLKLPALNRKFS